MTTKSRKMLLKAQQGELDAVILYKRLSDAIKDPEYKEIFKKVAADEGRHASILKEYTNQVLKPKSLKAHMVLFIYRVCGAKVTMRLLAKGEMDSIPGYLKLVQEFPNISSIIEDEARHAKIAESYLQKIS
ncbi:MAG: ferritin family protein [bacterium]|nr:ferritin family protein [bacterium]